eukprot:3904660-Amphidinium_carterae.1
MGQVGQWRPLPGGSWFRRGCKGQPEHDVAKASPINKLMADATLAREPNKPEVAAPRTWAYTLCPEVSTPPLPWASSVWFGGFCLGMCNLRRVVLHVDYSYACTRFERG